MSEQQPWDTGNVDALEPLNTGELGPLLALLRSDVPIHPEVRRLLADILDPKVDTEWRLAKIRKAGRPRSDPISVGFSVLNRVQRGSQVKVAVFDVMSETGLGETTVRNAYAATKAGYERVTRESRNFKK